MSNIKELIASKLRPIANAVRTKSGKTELIPVDDLEDEILALPDTEALRQNLKQIIEKTGTSFEIPYGIKIIGNNLFKEWTTLESVIIPDSVEEIGAYAFQGCSALKNAKIPDSVKTLGNYFFSGVAIQEVSIPEGITILPDNAFADSKIKIVRLPKTLLSFGKNAFLRMINFKEIYFNKTIEEYINTVNYTDENYNPFITKTADAYFLNENGEPEKMTDLVIPDNITTIKPYAFCRFDIETINFNNVNEIGKGAFRQCDRLTTLVIPDNVTVIGDMAFSYVNSIKEIIIGAGIQTIGAVCFDTSHQGWIVIIKATTPPSLGSRNFSNASKIFVPLGTRNAYISATNWSNLASKIVEPNTINISVPSQLLNNANYTYSIDGSSEFNQFTSSTITIENVSMIKFKNLDANTTILVGTSAGGSDIGTIANAELAHGTSGNQTIYLTIQA